MKSKHKIQIANVLLTRRCNLKCDYCNIVKNYVGRPADYKDMSHFHHNEHSWQEWAQVFDRVHKNNPNCFFILYGGEPFMHPQINDIVKYLKDNSYLHTIISNNTPIIRQKIKELCKYVGTLPGFTASIDPELCLYLDKKSVRDDDAVKKTIAGFEYLKYLKSNGYADDVVAEITVSSKNIDYLHRTVQILSENDIYCSITTIDDQKNNYYDFSNVTKNNPLMTQRDLKTRLIFDQIQKDTSLKIHMPELLDKLYDILPANMKCNIADDVHNITIDSDLTFRLCLRIAGTESGKIKILDGIDEEGKVAQKLIDAFKSDYDKNCEGCNWTCMIMSKHFSDNIITH